MTKFDKRFKKACDITVAACEQYINGTCEHHDMQQIGDSTRQYFDNHSGCEACKYLEKFRETMKEKGNGR